MKQRMSREVCFITVTALFTGLLCSAQGSSEQIRFHGGDLVPKPPQLTLQESIAIALVQSPKIEVARAQLEAAESRVKQSLTDLLPQLKASYSRSWDPLTREAAKANKSLDLSQALFLDKGLLFVRQQAKNDLLSAELGLLEAEQSLKLEVKQAYFDVLTKSGVVRLSQAVAERFQNQHEMVTKLFEQDKIAKVELLKVKAELDKAQVALQKSYSELEKAEITFNTVLYRELYDDVRIAPVGTGAPLAVSYTEEMSAAMENRPDWKQMLLSVENAALEIRVKRADQWPEASIGASYGNDIFENKGNSSVSLTASWDVWDWGKKKQLIAQAESAYRQTLSSQELLHETIGLEVKSKHLNLKLAESQIVSGKEIVRTAEENLKNQLVRFKNQQSTNTDLLDAQLLLAKSELELEQMEYEYHVAKAELERATGVDRIEALETRGLDLSDDAFLDLVERKAFYYFLENQHPRTGLFSDASGGGDASVGATGFGLAALCVGAERRWIGLQEARARAERTIDTFIDDPTDSTSKDLIAEGRDGFFYHFLNPRTADRAGVCEVSVIDTALLVLGAITAGEYFGGAVKEKADALYRQVDWKRFYDEQSRSFHMSWIPQDGMNKYAWNFFSDEVIIITLLAAGSPTYPVPIEAYRSFKRERGAYKNGRPFIYSWNGALFCHQYAHAWFDLRGMVDAEGTDWYRNSVDATIANRQFCMDNAGQYKTYGENSWGVSSFYRPEGYTMHFGASPCGSGMPVHDGTVSLAAPAGSIIFTPQVSLAALRYFYKSAGDLWGAYGLKNSYNMDEGWIASTYFGIDTGIMVLNIENARTGLIWRTFMKNQYVQHALALAGFKEQEDNRGK